MRGGGGAWVVVGAVYLAACGRVDFDPATAADAARDRADPVIDAPPIMFGDMVVEGQGPDQHPTGYATHR